MAIIRFENVSKHFGDESFGLKDITFSIEPGEFLFVTGQSGSGKTTLMRLLLKEYGITSGEIYLNDTPISSITLSKVHQHRRKIGMVFQDYKLINEMNIWENIALPLSVLGKKSDEIEQRVTDLLNLIHLPEKALHFPSQLSGGEAQRVGIARALAIGPEIVIADEPTGNLDPETAISIARLLKKINELGTTVLIATHDRNIIAQYPDTRVLVLEKGTLQNDTGSTKQASTAAAKKREETADESITIEIEDIDESHSEPQEKKAPPAEKHVKKHKKS